MRIREIKKEDIGTIMEIVNRNYDEVMIKVHSKEVVAKYKELNTLENWKRQMLWKEIFVVENNGEIIATGALANFGDDNSPKYCISNFFVKLEMHNQGIGKLFFNYILDVVKNKKIDSLHVPSSRSGFEFYKRIGFIEDDIQIDELDEITWMTMKIL
ncbi:MAG: GNAT family N-acetyltransferase [Bacillota bacterium]